MTTTEFDELLRTLIARASASAGTSRQRQLVALAVAYLDGDPGRADVLAREHLSDHPDDVLAAWIASQSCTDLEEER